MKIALAVDAFPSRSGVTGIWPGQRIAKPQRSPVHVLAREFTAAVPPSLHNGRRAGSLWRDARRSRTSLKADIVRHGAGRSAAVFTPPEPAESENSVELSGGLGCWLSATGPPLFRSRFSREDWPTTPLTAATPKASMMAADAYR